MSYTVTVEDAANRLADLISNLHPGDEITVLSENQPVARIIPPPSIPRRRIGACKGMLIINREDDSHLVDFKDYM